ncbi:MAG TPA: SprT family zinc-dependent metalloprotease [Thermoleophilaceae bacterium]|nr:SprT family zinc-dependent metalloprotease [Thermoleophilaceae bacterium]
MSGLPYSVRRSDRARHARVVVTTEGVELVVPRRMALRHATPLLREKRGWIERTLERMSEAERSLPAPRLEDGGFVPYLGRELRLRVAVEPGRGRPHVARRGDAVVVRLGDEGAHALRAALERWYRRQARLEVERRLDTAVERAGMSYGRLSIRGQRTRWASCSAAGAMSFNWRLLLAPERILNYVVEHEVAHLTVLDHSPRFWRLLAERFPRYLDHERWLRRHGPALRL